MRIDYDDIINAFKGSASLNLRLLQQVYQVQSLEVSPLSNAPLYLENDLAEPITLYLPLDRMIGQMTLLHQSYDVSKITFIKQIIANHSEPLTLIDIGANVGLFSRQCLNILKNIIGTIHLYEPHPINFKLLKRNLRGLKKANFYNVALGPRQCELEFFLDPNNVGNYSFNKNAMPDNKDEKLLDNITTISVNMISANKEKEKWMNTDTDLFIYKSDTQGYDETIATSFDLDFWDRVKFGSIELWRISGKEYDVSKFVKILDKFKNKVLELNPNQIVSSEDVVNYLNSNDRNYDDLLFWQD